MSLIPEREHRQHESQPEWAKRMERKLDTLIASLAEQEDETDRAFDLEGNPLPRERDPFEPL